VRVSQRPLSWRVFAINATLLAIATLLLAVLKLIAEAYTSKEIATELFISVKTVERHTGRTSLRSSA